MQSEIVENTLAEVCCACSTTNIHLSKTTDFDSCNIDILTKLRFCIPEVTWIKGYICTHCLDTLSQSYVFKELCIQTNQSPLLQDCQVLVKEENIYVNDLLVKPNDPKYDSSDNTSSEYDYGSLDSNPSGKCEDSKHEDDVEEEQTSRNSSIEQIVFKKEESNDFMPSETSLQEGKRRTGFTCDICNEFTGPYKDLMVHVADIHKVDPKTIRPYKCDLCNKRLTEQNKLKNHILAVHTDPNLWEYKCSYCDQKCPTKSRYDSHIRRHTGDKPFACHLCVKKFTEKNTLHNHLLTHSNVRNFKCDHCDSEYKMRYTLKMHLKKAHNIGDAKIPTLTCEICNEFTGTYKKLVAHVVDVHKVDPKTISPYKCNHCNNRYKSSMELAQHKISHTTKETFPNKGKCVKCDVCSKIFVRKCQLRSHVLLKHTDRSLWKHVCPFCDQRFATKWDCSRHVRYHKGEKPFACHLCDQKFTEKSVLQNHLSTHSDVRNFKCDYCDKEYKMKYTLKIHLKKAHNIGDTKVPGEGEKYHCEDEETSPFLPC